MNAHSKVLVARGCTRRPLVAAVRCRTPRLRCAALQSPGSPLQPTPVAEEDRALQSLVESGIRGSLACLFAYALNVNLLEAFHFDAADAALGLEVAAPLVLLDALLLLPDGARMASAGSASPDGPASAVLRVVGSALSLAQEERARFGLVGAAPPAQRAALLAASQLSEELLSRGVILGFAALWASNRLSEAGLGEETLGAGGPLLSEALRWAIAAVIVVATGMRYSHHASDEVTAIQARRRAAEAEAASRASLLRYQPLLDQEQHRAALAREAATASDAGRAGEALALGAHLLLGGRFMLCAAAAYGAYLWTDNLLASFTTGLALQLASSSLTSAAAGLRGTQE